jgi:hypothetical protein
MTAPTGAYVLRNATITIGATTFSNQLTKAQLVPDTPVQTLKTLVPDGVVQDVDTTSWTLELAGVQDWTNTTGIADSLNDANGTQVDCVLIPKAGVGKPKATFTIVAMPVDFGGEQGSFNTFEATFPVVGEPVFGTESS